MSIQQWVVGESTAEVLLDGGSITQYYPVFLPAGSITQYYQYFPVGKNTVGPPQQLVEEERQSVFSKPTSPEISFWTMLAPSPISILMVEGGKVSLKRVTGRPPWSYFGWIEQQGKLQRLGYKWAAAGQGGSMRKWLLGGGQTKAWGRFSSNKAATSWCPPRLLRDFTFFTDGGILIMMIKTKNSNYDGEAKAGGF